MSTATASPELDVTARLDVGGATEPQLRFLATLLREREVGDDTRAWIGRRIAGGTFDGPIASRTIGHCKAQPRKEGAVPATPAEPVTEGMYELDHRIYRVQAAKGSGRLYATVLINAATDLPVITADVDTGARGQHDTGVPKARLEYAPGLMRTLRAEHRMTPERAEGLSRFFTFCVRCTRHLTADDSVSRGIGPVCRKKV